MFQHALISKRLIVLAAYHMMQLWRLRMMVASPFNGHVPPGKTVYVDKGIDKLSLCFWFLKV